MYRLLNAKLENTVKLLVWRNKILQGNLPNRIPDVITHLGYPYTDELEDAMGFLVALAEGRYEKDVKILSTRATASKDPAFDYPDDVSGTDERDKHSADYLWGAGYSLLYPIGKPVPINLRVQPKVLVNWHRALKYEKQITEFINFSKNLNELAVTTSERTVAESGDISFVMKAHSSGAKVASFGAIGIMSKQVVNLLTAAGAFKDNDGKVCLTRSDAEEFDNRMDAVVERAGSVSAACKQMEAWQRLFANKLVVERGAKPRDVLALTLKGAEDCWQIKDDGTSDNKGGGIDWQQSKYSRIGTFTGKGSKGKGKQSGGKGKGKGASAQSICYDFQNGITPCWRKAQNGYCEFRHYFLPGETGTKRSGLGEGRNGMSERIWPSAAPGPPPLPAAPGLHLVQKKP
jgi:hypothetical protein